MLLDFHWYGWGPKVPFFVRGLFISHKIVIKAGGCYDQILNRVVSFSLLDNVFPSCILGAMLQTRYTFFPFSIFCKADVYYCLSRSSYFKRFNNVIQKINSLMIIEHVITPQLQFTFVDIRDICNNPTFLINSHNSWDVNNSGSMGSHFEENLISAVTVIRDVLSTLIFNQFCFALYVNNFLILNLTLYLGSNCTYTSIQLFFINILKHDTFTSTSTVQ